MFVCSTSWLKRRQCLITPPRKSLSTYTTSLICLKSIKQMMWGRKWPLGIVTCVVEYTIEVVINYNFLHRLLMRLHPLIIDCGCLTTFMSYTFKAYLYTNVFAKSRLCYYSWIYRQRYHSNGIYLGLKLLEIFAKMGLRCYKGGRLDSYKSCKKKNQKNRKEKAQKNDVDIEMIESEKEDESSLSEVNSTPLNDIQILFIGLILCHSTLGVCKFIYKVCTIMSHVCFGQCGGPIEVRVSSCVSSFY